MEGSQSAGSSENEEQTLVRELCANGICMKTTEVEAKLDEGNIQEAESSLREGLQLNFEEARALLGRLEYQRGNVEGALRVFDGIDLQAAIERLQPSISEKQPTKKVRSRNDSQNAVSQHAAGLVLEAIYLKAKSLQKLGRLSDAANECKNVLDAVEKIFQQGIPDVQVDSRLQDTVSQAVELLPELWKQAGCYEEAMSTYRRALLSQWNLDNDCCARIQKGFAVFLLHSGVEAGPLSLAAQIDGSYVPKQNLEEAVLLLMILIRKFYLGKTKWDPSVMEHLTFALSLCSQTSIVAKQLEEIMPGVFHRVDRWNTLALCYCGAGQNNVALNLLRNSLHKHERPDDLMALLLAAKICSEDSHLAAEGGGYAQRAIENAQGIDEHLKGVAVRMLGLCLGKQAKVSSSDFERSRLQSEALKSLEGAVAFEPNNHDLIFELGVQYAEQRNLNAALRCAKQFIDATGGSMLKGWRLLALVLAAQQRFSEAEVVTDAALDETAKWDQGPLLRLKAKLKISQSLPMDAIETYRYLLALVQARRKSFGPLRSISQVEDEKVNEFEVWHGLADLYSRLSHWKDVEVCLGKARGLKQYSAELLHTEGKPPRLS
ncbi:protein NPG1-like isoform X2 [Hevea brasiliensis]|uniref:protein NPG1-like isoform X2 n=1 Tax=Hevea brasiliensis TaxID=3981 RepID=UPI0025EE4780|nr:protein NPG1-like isoform X2 [Hevea brasiliensis]